MLQFSIVFEPLCLYTTVNISSFHFNFQIEFNFLQVKYLSFLTFRFSDLIAQYILSDSMRDACEHFKQLVYYHGCCVDNKTKCLNLTSYLKKTIMFWYKILKDKLSR